MTLNILTPDKLVYEGDVTSVTVPGSNGSFQILKNHAPIISSLTDGDVIIKVNTQEEIIGIKGGVVEVLNDKIVILAEAIRN
jgi:F-type H+-transporting ATPase subunit epsilon